MTDLVKVRVLRAHRNEFGDEFRKKAGATYMCPKGHAALLSGQKLVEIVSDGDAHKIRGGKAARKGTGPDRKDSDQEGAGAQGAEKSS